MTLGRSGPSLGAAVCLGLIAVSTACASGGATGVATSPETFASPPTVERGRALAALQRDQQRLDHVAFPLLRSARAICEGDDVVPRVGLRYASLASYPPAWQPAAQRSLDIGATPTVTSAPDGFPAASSGLRPGDRIVAAGETSLEDGEGGLQKLEAALSRLREGYGPVRLEVERDGEELAVELGPALEACRYGVVTRSDIGMQAFGDGSNIVVGSELLQSATDAELAVVVSHALAHNALGHVEAADAVAGSGGQPGSAESVAFASRSGTEGELPGSWPPPGAFSGPLELEADYVALYALANAGRNVEDAAMFWARMEQSESPLGRFVAAHPVSSERIARLEETAREIDKKREARLPLVPGPFDDPAPTAAVEDSAGEDPSPPFGEPSEPLADPNPVPPVVERTAESRATLIEELDESIHVWLRALDQGDFQAAAGMTGGVGDGSGLRYWWSAIRGDARRLASTQTLRIREVGGRYLLDVAASFDTGPEALVEVTIDQAGSVVRWRGGGSRPDGGSGDSGPHC